MTNHNDTDPLLEVDVVDGRATFPPMTVDRMRIRVLEAEPVSDLDFAANQREGVGVDWPAVGHLILTHHHGDHVGGLANAQGALNFPNATVHLSRPEWAAMQGNAQLAAIVSACDASSISTPTMYCVPRADDVVAMASPPQAPAARSATRAATAQSPACWNC